MRNKDGRKLKDAKGIYGVGTLGEGKYREKEYYHIQRKWRGMLSRCYSDKFIWHEHYKDVSVCSEWLDFQNFAKWYEDNYIEDCEMDKDLLQRGLKSKVYSPNTCVFLPKEINQMLVHISNKGRDLPRGVTKTSERTILPYKASYNMGQKRYSLGTFATVEEAFATYREAKLLKIYWKALEYYEKGMLTDRAFNALVDWDVEPYD